LGAGAHEETPLQQSHRISSSPAGTVSLVIANEVKQSDRCEWIAAPFGLAMTFLGRAHLKERPYRVEINDVFGAGNQR